MRLLSEVLLQTVWRLIYSIPLRKLYQRLRLEFPVCNHTVLMDRWSRTRDALQRHEKFNHSGEYSPTIQHHRHMPGPFIPHIDNETDSRSSHSPSVVQLLSESSPRYSPPAQIEQSFARNDHMSLPANTSLSPHYPVDLASAVSVFDQDLQSEASFPSSRSSSKSAVCEPFGSSMDSILLYCDTPDSYPSSLLPSPTSLLCSGLEIRPKSPELANISLPLAQMFDPLWDPWKAQQDAVRSYMADVHPVRRES